MCFDVCSLNAENFIQNVDFCGMKKVILLSTFLVFLSPLILVAQTDLGGWQSVQLKRSLSEDASASFKPIFRFNDQFSNYIDVFLDLDIRKNLDDGVWFNIRNRGILAPERKYNHWIFLDVGKTWTWSPKLSFSNQLRYHWGLKVNGFDDVDLLRYEPKIKYKITDALSAAVAWEGHYKVGEDHGYFRSRYSAGASYAITKRFGADLYLWLDDFSEFSGAQDIYLIITNLSYKL